MTRHSFVLLTLILAQPCLAQRFVDRSAELGLTIGSGPVSWGDVNGDGWPDLYAGGAVWINQGGTTFTRCEAAGGGLMADLDNDGVGDLVSFEPIGVFRGRREGDVIKFEPVALPELPRTVSLGAAVGDFDGDGLLDIFLGGFEDWEKQITYPSLLLLSEKGKGGKGFTLAKVCQEYRARGVTACDFDEDGDLDIYVSNYRLAPNVLWINDGQAKFTNEAAKYNVVATSAGFEGGHSIGACWGDFDGDGHLDLFAGSFAHVDSRGDQPKSRFLRNLGATKAWAFEDLHECGVWYQESYASPACADFDNDGALDLFFTTVYGDASFGKKNYPVLYRNETKGGVWSFKDVTEGWGLEHLPATYQTAWADVDQDGRMDVVTAGKLYMNVGKPEAGGGHWLELRLIGDGVKVNGGAVGAQARIKLPDGRVITRQVEVGTGQGSSSSPILHFGLGAFAGPATVVIRWPDGSTRTLADVAVDKLTVAAFAPEAGKAK